MAPSAVSAEQAIFSKIRLRLIPFLFLLYVVAYLDRVNVGFAALQMERDLGFGPQVYGRGAGIFFLGYTLFEVPSNLLMARVGARLWIARIMIVWGLVSGAMMFVDSIPLFYASRFLLGVAEAGFFPGMILYLTYWFPGPERAKAIAQFMTGTAIANIVGGPLSGLLLTLDGTMGLAGWQWLFIVEGIPAILLGFFVLYYLTEGPAEAHWLTADERKWLIARMEADRAASVGGHDSSSLKAALLSPRVWYFGFLYFTIVVGFYGITFWLPQILKNLSGSSDITVGLISAVPYVLAAIVMVVVATSSDRAGERRWHVAIPSFVSAVGLILSAATRDPVLSLAALSLAAAGIWGALGPFWSLPTAFLTGSAAAGGIALINSLGNLGGFLSPMLIGEIRARTNSFALALFVLAAAPLLTGLLVLIGVPGGALEPRKAPRPVEDSL